ncbi:hypothetical protein HPB49_026301 [Dermacentor silvarum]|nr:hypothetical protein HPB49_026301 [Dermacentor silvarum]
MDGSLIAIIAPKGERKAAFMCRKGYFAVNCIFICYADIRIPTVEPMRMVSDHDSFVWRTTWLRRRFQTGHIANPGEYLPGGSGYPLEPWLLTPVPGHPPTQTAEGKYTTAHAAMRLEVDWALDDPPPLSAAGNMVDDDENDDDSSSSRNSELTSNGDPIPHDLP